MNWKTITDDLYNKINPISGSLITRIDQNYVKTKTLESFYIEFKMNEFMYQDPFYGEQKSTSPFKMNVELANCIEDLQLQYVQSLENITIEDSSHYLKGAFSNSLHFSVPIIQFGKIKDRY